MVLWAYHGVIMFDLPFLPSTCPTVFIEITLPIESTVFCHHASHSLFMCEFQTYAIVPSTVKMMKIRKYQMKKNM